MFIDSRVPFIRCCIVLGGMVGVFGGSIPRTVADDWTQFGGPNRNFRVTENIPVSLGRIQDWRVPVHGGDDSPIVIGDRVLLSEMDYAKDGTDAHRLTCRQLSDGQLLWSKVFPEQSYITQDISDRYPVRPLASACIAGDCILSVGFGGTVRCVRWTDGELLWSHDLVREFDATPIQYGFASAPWSDGRQMVVACGGQQALLLSFRVADGDLLWKTGSGPASYASLIELDIPGSASSTKHLVYAGGDAVVGVEPETGKLLWQYDYPTTGLTNAVTPIAIAPGKLVVGGQGTSGSRMLNVVSKNETQFEVSEVWKNEKINPFYCNWVYLPDRDIIVGFAGKTLFCMDGQSGMTLWQKRGWTDSNVTVVNDNVYVLRGDGVLARVRIERSGIQVLNAALVTNDRVWSPMVVVDGRYLIRGRTGLSSNALNALPDADTLPEGTAVTSMDAMYGAPNERISELIQRAKAMPSPLTWEDYAMVANDASLQLGQGTYQTVIKALLDRDDKSLAERVARDWHERAPNAIEAWERWTDILELNGDENRLAQERHQRMVEVVFEFEIPSASSIDAELPESKVLVFGNAKALGNWKTDGLVLKPVSDNLVRGTAMIPNGDLQFKLALGSMDQVEVRLDNRSISNRRQRLYGPVVIRGKVAKWKTKP